jgi:hypothetical protein
MIKCKDMKKLFIYKSLVFVMLVFFTTSCEKFLDVNDDPNNPSSATVELVFPAAAGSAAYVIGGWYQILGGLWSQHWTQSTGAQQYRDFDKYDIQTTHLDDRQYGELYAGALNDLKYVKTTAEADENWTYYLMASVMQAYVFQVLVDLYEKVPFTDALKGADDDAILLPKFDEGKTVYTGCISILDEALSKDLTLSSAKTPGADDIIFQGDMSMWVKFANTLKLKLYMRLIEADATWADAGLTALYATNPAFLDGDATMTAFASEQNKRNPVYETEFDRFGGVNIVASNTLLLYLQNASDPRINGIFDLPASGSGAHTGLDQGDFFNPGFTSAADLSQPAISSTEPVYFMSAAESYFLQAEAALRGYGSGDAKSLYEMGIEASFLKFGQTGASTLYGTGGMYEFTGTDDDKLEAIIVQKWISMANSQGLESFFEQNRTGYPDFYTISINSSWGADQFPRRLLYPDSEYQTNKANVPTLKRVYEKMWWHK